MLQLRVLPLAIIVLILTAHSVSADPAEAPIQISFDDRAVHASGVTRGGGAVVFAATIGRYSGMRKLGRHARIVTDEDEDGAITLAVEEVPITSVWAVVDLQSGRYTVAAPAGFALRKMDLPSHGWRGGLQHMDIRRDYLEVLVVRPGVGAWTLRASEGGRNDDDGTLNTVLRTKLSRMQRIHGTDTVPRPPVVIPKDLLLIIDPHELDYFASEAQ